MAQNGKSRWNSGVANDKPASGIEVPVILYLCE